MTHQFLPRSWVPQALMMTVFVVRYAIAAILAPRPASSPLSVQST